MLQIIETEHGVRPDTVTTSTDGERRFVRTHRPSAWDELRLEARFPDSDTGTHRWIPVLAVTYFSNTKIPAPVDLSILVQHGDGSAASYVHILSNGLPGQKRDDLMIDGAAVPDSESLTEWLTRHAYALSDIPEGMIQMRKTVSAVERGMDTGDFANPLIIA